MADKNIIVNPIKTQPTVNRAIATPNVSGNMGIERRAAETMDKILYEMDEIKTKNEIIGGEAAYAEVQEKVLEYQSMVRHNKEYYQDGTKLAELQSSIGEIKDKYRKMAQNNGYDMRFVNAYVDRMDQGYKASEQVFYQKFAEYSKKLQTDNYLLVMDKKSKNNLTLAGIGDINGALDNYKENVDNLLRGQKEGFISMSELINAAGNLKNGIFHSYVNSFIDDPDGIEKLNAMANYTDEQINQIFEGFNFEKDGYLSVNTPEDFESFRRSVARAVSAYETKRKAQEEATLYEATKQIQYRKENNFAIESKKYSATVPPSQIGETLYVDSTNNYYGTAFKDWREPIQLGYQFKLLDDSNSQEKFYNDIGISGVELINKNVEEYQMYAGGKEEDFARATRDGMAIDYHSRGVKTAYGYNVNKQLQNAGSETSNLLVRTYTPESRQVLSKINNVNLNFTGNFEKFKEYKATFKTGRPTSSMAPSIPYGATAQMNTKEPEWEVLIGEEFENNKYTDLSVIGTIEGLGYTASKGDVNAKATSQDLTNIASDVFKLMAIEKMSGILSEDIADDLKMKASAGMFITDLSLSEQKKVFNYILREDDELKEEFVKVFEPVAKEILGDTQIGTLTNGRFIRLNGVTNVSKEVRGLDDYMENNDFIAIVGKNPDGTDKTKIVKGKELVPISTSDGKQILITYNGNPVILNNAVAVYEVGGIE